MTKAQRKKFGPWMWMGCLVALYDMTGQMNHSEEGGNPSRTSSRARRRGCRGARLGNKPNRTVRRLKCRDVTVVDPEISSVKQAIHARRSGVRRAYLEARRKKHSAGLISNLVRLYNLSRQMSARNWRKAALRRSIMSMRSSWIHLHVLRGDPPSLARASLDTSLKVSLYGWGSLTQPDIRLAGPQITNQVPPPRALTVEGQREGVRPVRRGARFTNQCVNCRTSWQSRSRALPCPRCFPETRTPRGFAPRGRRAG